MGQKKLQSEDAKRRQEAEEIERIRAVNLEEED